MSDVNEWTIVRCAYCGKILWSGNHKLPWNCITEPCNCQKPVRLEIVGVMRRAECTTGEPYTLPPERGEVIRSNRC
jgi:hypothetical protein